VDSACIVPASAAAPASSGWPHRNASLRSGGAARTTAIIAACSAVTVANGRAAAASAATQGACSKDTAQHRREVCR
jgi:hypothetical protein